MLDSWHAFLTWIGKYATANQIARLNADLNYLETGRWLDAQELHASPRYATRSQFHAAVAALVAHTPVLFLEFGVYKGDSLRTWLALLPHPESQLHGFDSFEGLPETWNAGLPKGAFSLGGEMPRIDDPRVTLHKGWFSEILPSFPLPSHGQLVIHLDADLYSSTDCVLRTLQDHIVPGTILIFDEFIDRMHELRAFDEYLNRSGHRYEFLAATKALEQVSFRRVA